MQYIDPTTAASENYKTLLENDQVRVLEMTLPAGSMDNRHSHPNETVFFVKGGKVRIYLDDGEALEAELPDEHVMWHEAWTHTVQNLGSTDIRAIIIEDMRTRSAS